MNTNTLERVDTIQSRSLKDLRGYVVQATDGQIGKVKDVYFDDVTWALRYFVVETGGWLDRRPVLVAPSAFQDSDGLRSTITTDMTRSQIKNAPPVELAKPVSRQFEIKLHEHFAWPMYWVNAPEALQGPDGDAHLRSLQEVLGYGIRANDGEIGHVEDVIVEERSWITRYLVIDTKNWLPGRKVLVSPLWVDDVSWAENVVSVDMTREKIENSPGYDPGQPVNRVYEEKLFDYYMRPKYWR